MITAQELKQARTALVESALAAIEENIKKAENNGKRTCSYYLRPNDDIKSIIEKLNNYGFTAKHEHECDPREQHSRGSICIWWE